MNPNSNQSGFSFSRPSNVELKILKNAQEELKNQIMKLIHEYKPDNKEMQEVLTTYYRDIIRMIRTNSGNRTRDFYYKARRNPRRTAELDAYLLGTLKQCTCQLNECTAAPGSNLYNANASQVCLAFKQAADAVWNEYLQAIQWLANH